MTDVTNSVEGRPDAEGDEEERGGPAHPAPGHLPPDPSPPGADEADDEQDGGPAHPAPGHLPPASP